jgi:hypothetical protein
MGVAGGGQEVHFVVDECAKRMGMVASEREDPPRSFESDEMDFI